MIEIDEELKTITITLEEYKELLIIKGKYEELSKRCKKPTNTYNPNIPYRTSCKETRKTNSFK